MLSKFFRTLLNGDPQTNIGFDIGATPYYPACFPEVICVGATNENDEKTSFSNFGNPIDVMAPGKSILSTISGNISPPYSPPYQYANDTYSSQDGTSMAAPLVSGLCALMWAHSPGSTALEIRACLENNCDYIDDLNDVSYEFLLGNGRINAFQALGCLTNETYANFTSDVTEICAGDFISFNDESIGSPVSWEWQVTPAAGVFYSPNEFYPNPDITFDIPGTYTISLTVFDGTTQNTLIFDDYIIVHDPALTIATLEAEVYYCLQSNEPACSASAVDNCTTVCDGSEQTLRIHFNGNPPFSAVITDGSNMYNVNTTYFPNLDIDEYNYFANVNVFVDATHNQFWIQSINDGYCPGTGFNTVGFTVKDCCPNLIVDGDFEGINEIPANRTDLDWKWGSPPPSSIHNTYEIINAPLVPTIGMSMAIDGTSQNQNPPPGIPVLLWSSEETNVTINTEYIVGFYNTQSGWVISYNSWWSIERGEQQLNLSFRIMDGATLLYSEDIKYPNTATSHEWFVNNFCWTSPISGTIRIEIYQVEEFEGVFYDYYLDNIFIRAVNVPPLTASITNTDVTCFGNCDGTATVTGGGGVGPYTYLWDDPLLQNTQTATGLCAGIYNVIVTDVNGCSAINNITILPGALIPDASFTYSVPGSNCIEVGEIVYFYSEGVSGTEYLWTFGDGNDSNLPDPENTYDDIGYYCVTLTATSQCGQSINNINDLFVHNPNCPCNIPYDVHHGQEIFGANTWNPVSFNATEITLDGDLIIKNGAYLTIEDLVLQFNNRGRIIVEPEAVLKLDNCELSRMGDCGMWQGIEVWGVSNQPSNPVGVQGQVILAKEVLIHHAHIGILLGKRRMDHICDPDPGNEFETFFSGGILKTTQISQPAIRNQFRNNGIDIKYVRKMDFDASENDIYSLDFSCVNVIDEHYDSQSGLNTYPNEHNPWAGKANIGVRTYSAIEIENQEDLNIFDCTFTNKEFGINSKDAQFNIYDSDFLHTRYGIRIDEYTPGITFAHTIDNCNFTDIEGPLNLSGYAININSSEGDLIQNCVFENTGLNVDQFEYGIKFSGTIDFDIIENVFTRNMMGIVVRDGVNGWIGADDPSWLGNRFIDCEHGILTQFINNNVALKCNDHNQGPLSDYTYTWDNAGELAAQGTNLTGQANDPAGNRFTNGFKLIESLLPGYEYYFFGDDQNPANIYRPDAIPPIGNNITTLAWDVNSVRCLPSDPIPTFLPPLSFSVQPYLKIDSLAIVNDNLIQMLDSIMAKLDKGATIMLINEIENNHSQGSLKNMLIAHSPLSDTVLYTLIFEDALVPGNFKNVMFYNLPVSRNIAPDFYTYIENLPNGIKNQLMELQGYNPYSITPTTITRKIDQLETAYFKLLNDIVSTLLDTNHNRLDDAIQVLEHDNSDNSKRILFGTYLREGDYSLAMQKLNELQGTGSENDDFVTLSQIILSLYQQGKTIYDIDSSDYSFVYDLAFNCPPYPAVYSARAIVYIITGIEIPECPVDIGTKSLVISANQNNNTLPDKHINMDNYLGNNYPDPFSEKTIIPFSLIDDTEGKIVIKDLLGRTMKEMKILPENDEVIVNADGWAEGVYTYSLVINGKLIKTMKMVLSK